MAENIFVRCFKCKKQYELSNSVRRLTCCYEDDDGMKKDLLLTYSVCPVCGHIHLSQLDDDITKPMVKELSRLMKKKILFDSKGREMKRKDKRKVLELNKQLNTTRLLLMANCQGKELHKKYFDKNKEINNTFTFTYSEPELVVQDKNENRV